MALLEVDRLTITTLGGKIVLADLSLAVRPGEVVALIGESGSGKTTASLAALGLVRPGLVVRKGTVRLGGDDLFTLLDEALRRLRGRRMAYVAQSAAAAFNPSLSVGRQVTEPMLVHGLASPAEAERRAVELYGQLGLPDPARIGRRFPHQVSGGQLQRLMAAMALGGGPDLLVLDEPTTALDVTTQMDVLKAFKEAIRERGAAAIYVSHDLAVVAQIADRVLVLLDGRLQEQGAVADVIARPRSDYGRRLTEASDIVGLRARARAHHLPATPEPRQPVLEAQGLSAGYGTALGHTPLLRVIDGVSFTLRRGEVVGVIGESGSGKSTLARVLAGLLPPFEGQIRIGDRVLPPLLANRTRYDLRRVQLVFQSADTALNPAHTVGTLLGRPIAFYRSVRGAENRRMVAELLDKVRLPRTMMNHRPADLSGGQKQRVNLARALAADPEVVLCDEVTSALDTLVRAAIIDLIDDLRRTLGIAFMFISHDIASIAAVADTVVVMYRGKVVEAGTTDQVLSQPAHAYTRVLMQSVPRLEVGWLDTAFAEREALLRSAEIRLSDR